jgi:hypothetical protein
MVGVFGDITTLGLWENLVTIVILSSLCLIISLVLMSYLREVVNRTIALPVLIGGTLGYILSIWAVLFLG